MTVDIRWLWSRINANYWFYPALFSIAGAVLARKAKTNIERNVFIVKVPLDVTRLSAGISPRKEMAGMQARTLPNRLHIRQPLMSSFYISKILFTVRHVETRVKRRPANLAVQDQPLAATRRRMAVEIFGEIFRLVRTPQLAFSRETRGGASEKTES